MCGENKEEDQYYKSFKWRCKSCHNRIQIASNKKRYAESAEIRAKHRAQVDRRGQDPIIKERIRKQRALIDAKRRSGKANPPKEELGEIYNFYMSCPRDLVVDHVIPLRGKEVCGLHRLNNLQYLTPAQNMAKRNKLIE